MSFADEKYMDKHTIKKLEFDKIKNLLHSKCHTPLGIEKVKSLFPSTNYDEIKQNLDETFQLKEILTFEEPFAIQTLDPIDTLLSKLKIDMTYLEPSEYLKIGHFLSVARSMKRYMRGKTDKYPLIAAYTSEIQEAPEISKKIDNAIDRAGEIKDNASPTLRKIRIEKQLARNKILSKLEALIHSRRPSGTRQDDLITIRDERFVIPVATSEFTSRSGVIHGRSKSGATFFVEPMETVEMNNQMRELTDDERAEIERILIDIGDSIREKIYTLDQNYKQIGQVDFIHSKARLAIQLNCEQAELIDSPLLELKNARHPLLLIAAEQTDDVIPIDIQLGMDFDCMVITGPNMGGKTVSLKTVGLYALMFQSGLMIPVGKDSRFGIFKHVFADIGDEQSIELSLSTFSSHISKIISALKNCSFDSLILMDELGAGTDPLEGSALGEAILMRILECKGKAIITTHYSALKTLPEKNSRIQNASLEFDHKTLKPTYRLIIGLPGSSYAIEMAKRLGMPEDIISNAVGLMGTQERTLTELIERLQRETKAAENERQEIVIQKEEAEKLKNFYLDRKSKIQAEQKEYKQKALSEAHDLVEGTRAELESLVREIRESNADKQSIRKAHKYIRETKSEFKDRQNKLSPQVDNKKELLQPGDAVFIENLQAQGELLDYSENTDSWRVQTGSLVATIKSELLTKQGKKVTKPKLPAGVNYAPFDDVSLQISVRGMTADEALSAVEKYLDSVSIANLEKVFILHGKGTGALRKAIGEYLKTHPLVEKSRLGYYNEGGAGVTVVTLKKS
jgi:DNA mismatch repair protein MutS2